MTAKTWPPSASVGVVKPDVHEAKAPASTTHRNCAPVSPENENVAFAVLDRLAGALLIVGGAGTCRSTVHVRVTATLGFLPGAVAVRVNVCDPSASLV